MLNEIRKLAKELEFDLVRVYSVKKLQEDADFFRTWLAKGFAGSMDYLKKDPEKRSDPQKILPGAKSVICLGMNYYQPSGGPIKIARYALGRDYHKVIEKKLKKFCALLESKARYVDYGPVLERSFSQKSGMGFIGKNTCIITREFGSYVFLAEIFTSLELVPDSPSTWKGSCGSCRRCIEACPTGAIKEDRSIDATKCISYLTIENRGPIPEELREKVGTWLFGCDICQEVCPHNVRAKPTKVEDFKNIRIGTSVQSLREILEIKDEDAFKEKFAGTPIMRAKRRGMMRNACVVAGNLKEKSLLPSLQKLAEDRDELIREHAKWAIQQM